MPDIETALSILATEIKNAGYSVRITCNAVQVSLKNMKVHPYIVERVLDDAGMEDLYTTNYACGSTFVRPIIA
jgi:hypothetical protein